MPAKFGNFDPKRTGSNWPFHADAMGIAGIKSDPPGLTKNPRLRLSPWGRNVEMRTELIPQRGQLRTLGEAVSGRPARGAACALLSLGIPKVPISDQGMVPSPASTYFECGTSAQRPVDTKKPQHFRAREGGSSEDTAKKLAKHRLLLILCLRL